MSVRDDGGPAFPNSVKITNDDYAELRGMTLRDYFAAKAMQASITTAAAPWMHTDKWCAGAVADMAYEVADAMLEARKK